MASSSSAACSKRSSSYILLSASECTLSSNLLPIKIAESYHLSSSLIDPPLFTSTSCPVVDSAEQISSTNAMVYNSSISSCSEKKLESNDSEIERLRSCDVYVGYCDRKDPLLIRLVNWLRAEIVMYGFSCFVSYRPRCSDARSHVIARTALEEASVGLVIVTRKSFSSPWSVEEIKILSRKKNLILIFFGLKQEDCLSRDIVEKKGEIWGKYEGALWKKYEGVEEEWGKVLDGISRLDAKFEVCSSNMRDCVLDVISLIGKKLGRGDALEKLIKWKNKIDLEEFPFTRNHNFIGRKKELLELKLMLFDDVQMERDDDFIDILPEKSCRSNNETHKMKNKGKMTGQWVLKESKEEIEVTYKNNPKDFGRFAPRKQKARSGRKSRSSDLAYGSGMVCISGEPGIGKTELVLEFAYRYSQMYKMVLWIGGEERYIRVNYMNLLSSLGIDMSIVNSELDLKTAYPRNFEETESEAIQKVRRELMRGIPYLLVIDNLENEKDLWDGRKILDLLPRIGGETHVIISTRLPSVMNIQTLQLYCLSTAESMSLMMRNTRDIETVEDCLKIIGERICRLPLGLALVGGILSICSIDPPTLLEAISIMPYSEIQWSDGEEDVFKHNIFLVQLLDFIFLLVNRRMKHGKLAMKMMLVSGWFAPSPVPISMLALATEAPKEKQNACFLKNYFQMLTSGKINSHSNLLKDEAASNMLIRLNLAKSNPKKGLISFHNITRVYACKIGGDRYASSMVRAVGIQGCLPLHLNHIWASCFLIFKFRPPSTVLNLSAYDLLSFIRQFVLPLANQSFASLSQCDLILDLLRHSTEILESMEDVVLTDADNEEAIPFCFMRSSTSSSLHPDPLIYQDIAYLRAAILEMRAKFMLLCGQYEIAEQLCRTAFNIKEVINGLGHSETLSTNEVMERLLGSQPSFSTA